MGAVNERCRTAIPSVSPTSSRSTGPVRPACWSCSEIQVSVGTPQTRYQPPESVVVEAVRSRSTARSVVRSKSRSCHDIASTTSGSGFSLSVSTTCPKITPVCCGRVTPGQSAPRSFAAGGSRTSAVFHGVSEREGTNVSNCMQECRQTSVLLLGRREGVYGSIAIHPLNHVPPNLGARRALRVDRAVSGVASQMSPQRHHSAHGSCACWGFVPLVPWCEPTQPIQRPLATVRDRGEPHHV